MALPVKHSVAVVLRKGDQILILRRPDDESELPGIWGLPAGSYRPGETLDDLVRRIGTGKLGVALTPVRKLVEGSQERETYRLEMELWEVTAQGLPQRGEWRWSSTDRLEEGRQKGSLCCDLALRSLTGK